MGIAEQVYEIAIFKNDNAVLPDDPHMQAKENRVLQSKKLRNINGNWIAEERDDLYKITIDIILMNHPIKQEILVGDKVVVHSMHPIHQCIAEGETSIVVTRRVVEGSMKMWNMPGAKLNLDADEKTIQLEGMLSQCVLLYQPKIEMRITGMEVNATASKNAEICYRLTLEEEGVE